jgi:hypothetical protein
MGKELQYSFKHPYFNLNYMNKININNKEYTVERCGIIPYCKINNDEYKILLGLKSNYGKFYGDLGGGIKKTETYLDGLIREIFEESSRLIFPDVFAILNSLLKCKSIIHHTNSKSRGMTSELCNNSKSVFIEFLVPIPFSEKYITHFSDYKIQEHLEFRWFDVKRVEYDYRIMNFNIKEQLDGSLKPLINKVLDSLKNEGLNTKDILHKLI